MVYPEGYSVVMHCRSPIPSGPPSAAGPLRAGFCKEQMKTGEASRYMRRCMTLCVILHVLLHAVSHYLSILAKKRRCKRKAAGIAASAAPHALRMLCIRRHLLKATEGPHLREPTA